jgi:hypothetical protein
VIRAAEPIEAGSQLLPDARVAFDERWERIDHRDPDDSNENNEPADPTENADRTDPTEPTESTDPIEPIDRKEPLEAIHRVESTEPSDQRDREVLGAIQ